MDEKRPSRTFVYRKSSIKAKPVKMEKNKAPSFDFCQVKDSCQYCPNVNEDYDQTLKSKYQRRLEKIQTSDAFKNVRFVPAVSSPKTLGYRPTTKVYFKENKNTEEFGLYSVQLSGVNAQKGHDISYCPLHSKSVGQFIRKLKSAMENSQIKPFNDKDQTGNLHSLELKSSHLTDEILAIFYVNSELKNELRQLISQLKSMEARIISAYMSIKTEDGFQTPVRVAGADYLRENFCELNINIDANIAMQENPWQYINFMRRLEQISDIPKQGSVAWDLSKFNGDLSLLLGKIGFNVCYFNSNSDSIANAQFNSKKNTLEGKIQFFEEDLTNFTDIPAHKESPDLIIVDGSQNAIDQASFARIANVMVNTPKTKLIYISSNVDHLVQDIEKLCKTGKSVRQVEAFDFQPQGHSLMWLCILV